MDQNTEMTDPTSSPTPQIRGVHLMFYYTDLQAAADWYETVIGLERILSFEGLEMFRISGSSCLALVGEGYGSQRPIAGPNKGAILSIETEELAEWHERLFARGTNGTGRGVEVGADGRTLEFKVYDPGGYTVEFFEWID